MTNCERQSAASGSKSSARAMSARVEPAHRWRRRSGNHRKKIRQLSTRQHAQSADRPRIDACIVESPAGRRGIIDPRRPHES